MEGSFNAIDPALNLLCFVVTAHLFEFPSEIQVFIGISVQLKHGFVVNVEFGGFGVALTLHSFGSSKGGFCFTDIDFDVAHLFRPNCVELFPKGLNVDFFAFQKRHRPCLELERAIVPMVLEIDFDLKTRSCL